METLNETLGNEKKETLSIPEECIFIDNLLTEFSDYLPLTVIYKLHVIKCASSNMNNTQILDSLARLSENDFFIGNRSDNDIEDGKRALEVYNNKDRKKLNRLKKITSIPHLLKIIGYENFIYAVIEKYPFPCIVGYHFKEWTPKIIRNYIRLYFHISNKKTERKKNSIKIPELNTIKNIMYYSSKPHSPYPATYSVKTILDYYIKEPLDIDFYIIYWEKNFYNVSAKDKAHTHIGQRYDGTFFYILLSLTYPSMSIKINDINSASYNSVTHMIDWSSCFEECYKTAFEYSKPHHKDDFKIVLLFKKGILQDDSFELCEYSNKLALVPDYSLLPYQKLDDIISSLKLLLDKYIISESYFNANRTKDLIKGFENVKNKFTQLDKQQLSKRADKYNYMKKIKEIVNSNPNNSKI